MLSKIFAPLVCYVSIQKIMKPKNLFAIFCILMFGLGLCATLAGIYLNKLSQNYYYTIIAPDRGTWYTTNSVNVYAYYVTFDVENQNIRISPPYTIIKEVYAPTNFIDENE